MKIEVRKDPYTITDGNGGIKQARVVDMPKLPPRVHYVTRKGNRGRFTIRHDSVTLPAFRKLLVEQA